ncbi:MAG TPA: glycine zipper 2TM domain-containing protein [Rhizomicrobium sp.]|nr:glycine zipper 2TM domain-containing protein [Rhizomicrobium sp.]
MSNHAVKFLAVAALALGAATTAANAGCEGRKTTGTVVGGATGGIVGSAITHGSVVGVVGGAVVGGLAGHSIAGDGCHSHYHHTGYYDRDHHWHRYAT